MISPGNLMKRVGVGGQLVPFFKCVCVYFAVGGGGAGGDAPSLAGVAAKCAPVLCLMLAVLLTHPRGGYARRIALGLSLSALGDALLVWPAQLAAGMAAFGAAHCAYVSALGWRPPAPRLGALAYSAAALYLTLLEAPPALARLVPLYAALLATTAWRAAARALGSGAAPGGAGGADAWASRAAAAGALLFLLSDALLGYSMFGGTLPYKQVLVMSTYYLGQLGLALSALHEPQPSSSSATGSPALSPAVAAH